MSTQARKLDIRIHDAQLSLWQDDAQDPTFRRDVFDGLTRLLGQRGWTIGRDERVHKHYRCISKDHRIARKGELIAALRVAGRSVELEVWAETWVKSNSNGHRYDFDKRKRMGFLTRLRLDLEFSGVVAWASTIATTSVTDANKDQRGPHRDGLTALQWIERDYADSWHKDKTLGRPVPLSERDARSADGGTIKQGATVWFTDRKGRICRGAAFFRLNNIWSIVTSQWGLEHRSSHEIYCEMPDDLRRRRNERERRRRLEGELARAVADMDFERAIVLRGILFGRQDVFLIWSSKNDAFYGPNCAGYTTDRIHAGRYTRQEAAREVGRVPHLMSAVDATGRHLDAKQLLAGAA